jgi:chemotaxis protein CheD
MTDTMVRMGELAAAQADAGLLVTLGLGSCIGLALLDREAGVAGLAHVVLPSSDGHPVAKSFKFADHAVPELIARVVALGGRPERLEAVIVGGASMFASTGGTLGVGQRNEEAIRELLATERLRIAAVATGGKRGRTIRVEPQSGVVTVREAGGVETQLHPALLSPRPLQEVR